MMPVQHSLRRGWCPGALRPMQSGDGLIVRIKPSCGVLTLEQAEAITTLARVHGNGLIELTSRANLQLRGIREETLDALMAALDRLGLLDAAPEGEAVRNVISSPLAGINPVALDTRPVVRALEQRLTSDTSLAGLSDKFGFVVDGGGQLPLDDTEADVRFVWRKDHFVVGLAREPGCDWIGTCGANEVPDAAIALARAFLAHADGVRRMRHASNDQRQRITDTAGVATWGQTHGSDPVHNAASRPAVGVIGPMGDACVAGIGLPYGGTTAEALRALATLARHAGASEFRLTPWRAILIPVADDNAAARVLDHAARLGFITDLADARRAIAACPGAPACGNGSTAVRSDADRFAAVASVLLDDGAKLHVSGCAKGCARRQPATLTLVAEAGRYGIVVNGTAAEAATGRFAPEEMVEVLARLAAAVTKAATKSSGQQGGALLAALREIGAA